VQVTLARVLGRLAFWLRFSCWLTAPARLMVALGWAHLICKEQKNAVNYLAGLYGFAV